MKTYTDSVTQKTITYTDNDFFVIKTRAGFNSKATHKVFSAASIDAAVKEFYALVVTDTYYKYLFQVPEGKKSSEDTLIFRMKGQVSKQSLENLIIKNKIPKNKMEFCSIAVLNNCPAQLASELNKENFLEYPASISRWTKVKLIYTLLAYFVSLPQEEKNKILYIGDRELIKHKELSGYSLQDDSLIKVEVISKDELL